MKGECWREENVGGRREKGLLHYSIQHVALFHILLQVETLNDKRGRIINQKRDNEKRNSKKRKERLKKEEEKATKNEKKRINMSKKRENEKKEKEASLETKRLEQQGEPPQKRQKRKQGTAYQSILVSEVRGYRFTNSKIEIQARFTGDKVKKEWESDVRWKHLDYVKERGAPLLAAFMMSSFPATSEDTWSKPQKKAADKLRTWGANFIRDNRQRTRLKRQRK